MEGAFTPQLVENAANLVFLVPDRKRLRSVEPYSHDRGVFGGEPKCANLLIFSNKIGFFDPEGESLRRMACYFDDSVVLRINPNGTFEKIFVFAFWNGANNKTSAISHLFFTKHFERI